ncbi:MAG TPA: hypothetical protein VNW04_03320 [Puia sp.]|jgi:hypothetical protein|nr:hypothetical protein [Puia sp.]
MKKILRIDVFLLVLAIGLSIIIYCTPSITIGHMDLKGTVNGTGSRGTIFVLPGIAMFVFIVFNVLEKYPSFLIKGDHADDPKTQAGVLLYWRVLKVLCLLTMACILIVTYFPGVRSILLAIVCLFTLYNLVFLFKSWRRPI